MLHMLHAECLTVDPDHFNRNTEALPQAHRKKPLPRTSEAFTTSRNHVAAFPGLCPCHLDTRSLRDLPKTMFLRAAHVTIPFKPRPRSRSLGPTEHLGIFAGYMCYLACDLGRRDLPLDPSLCRLGLD